MWVRFDGVLPPTDLYVTLCYLRSNENKVDLVFLSRPNQKPNLTQPNPHPNIGLGHIRHTPSDLYVTTLYYSKTNENKSLTLLQKSHRAFFYFRHTLALTLTTCYKLRPKNFSRPLGLQGHKKWKSSTRLAQNCISPARFLPNATGKSASLPEEAPPFPLPSPLLSPILPLSFPL